MNTPEKIIEVVEEVKTLLVAKNRKYGDLALNPVRIFSRANPIEQLKVRIDDKLSRIANGHGDDLDEDTVIDLIGYLVLFRVAQKNGQEEDVRSVDEKLTEAASEFHPRSSAPYPHPNPPLKED